jgi:predicted transcriptional regulator YdeE
MRCVIEGKVLEIIETNYKIVTMWLDGKPKNYDEKDMIFKLYQNLSNPPSESKLREISSMMQYSDEFIMYY